MKKTLMQEENWTQVIFNDTEEERKLFEVLLGDLIDERKEMITNEFDNIII